MLSACPSPQSHTNKLSVGTCGPGADGDSLCGPGVDFDSLFSALILDYTICVLEFDMITDEQCLIKLY